MGGGLSLGGSSGRMGGFGSETGGPTNFGGYSGGVYGDGGGFGGQESSYGDTQARRDKFEEYDEYDEGAVAAPGRRQSDVTSPPRSRREAKKPAAAKPKAPEEDLFDFGDDTTTTPAAPAASNGKAPATSALGDFGADDDDFDDFQSAAPAAAPAKATASGGAFAIAPPASTSTTTSATQFAQPKPVSAAQGQNINDLFASVSPPPRTGSTASSAFTPLSPPTAPSTTTSTFQNKPPQPSGYQATGPNYFQSVQAGQTGSGASTPMSGAGKIGGAKPAAGGDAFASLLGGGVKKTGPIKGASMADMQRQKASAGIWGASPSPATPQAGAPPAQQQKAGNGLDDLLG